MLDKKQKDKVMSKFAVHVGDTGSSQVQIALLTEEIKELAEHLKAHKHDFSSRHGLIRKLSQRRKLLRYLESENAQAYDDLIKQLKIKRRIVEQIKPLLDEEEPVPAIEHVADEAAA